MCVNDERPRAAAHFGAGLVLRLEKVGSEEVELVKLLRVLSPAVGVHLGEPGRDELKGVVAGDAHVEGEREGLVQVVGAEAMALIDEEVDDRHAHLARVAELDEHAQVGRDLAWGGGGTGAGRHGKGPHLGRCAG